MARLLPILLAILFLSACDTNRGNPTLDIQKAATTWRYQKPDGVVPADQLVSSIDIRLQNRFPVWKENIDVAIDVTFANTTKSHLPARTKAQLFVYSIDEKQPLYWSNIDLAYGESTGPTTMSILSLPVNAHKELMIPIHGTTWAGVRSQIWPDSPFYSFIPSGKYLMRMELDFFDDNDTFVGTAVSNFIEFTSVISTPAPQGVKK